MKGLHEIKVIHRDIKLANILINDNVLKIADLGFAKQLGDLVIIFLKNRIHLE